MPVKIIQKGRGKADDKVNELGSWPAKPLTCFSNILLPHALTVGDIFKVKSTNSLTSFITLFIETG